MIANLKNSIIKTKKLEAQRIANAKYQQKESFEKKNMTSVHEGKKPFKCDICKKRFAQV